jgi:hypothetical protein
MIFNKKHAIPFLVFAFFFLNSVVIQAKTCTSVATGDWGTGATWSCSPAGSPECGDDLIIETGHTVTVSNNYQWHNGGCSSQPTNIIVRGTLHFTGGGRLQLAAGSNITVETGGSITAANYTGNNNLINLGGTEIWNAGSEGGPVLGPWINGDEVLPVKLISFELFNMGTSIEVKWSTASEINNDYFKVERSRDGENWFSIGTVRGAGNSSSRKDYTLTDYSPLLGEQWYRLVQVDYDGNFEIFDPILVKFTGVERISIYPNPAKDEVTIVLHDFVGNYVVLSDSYGRVINSWILSDVDQLRVPLQDCSPGFYTVNVRGDGFSYASRLIVE